MCEGEDIVVIEVDHDLEAITPEFLENRAKDCQLIEQLLQTAAFSDIRTIGHRMKGAGGSYGFDEISELGEIIEEAALISDSEAICNAIRRLSDYLQRITVVYV